MVCLYRVFNLLLVSSFTTQKLREAETIHQLLKLTQAYWLPNLNTTVLADTEGWVPSRRFLQVEDSFVWSLPKPHISTSFSAVIKCDATSPGKNHKRCSQIYKQGYYWDRAYRVTDMLACSTANCMVNLNFEISLAAHEKDANTGHKQPIDDGLACIDYRKDVETYTSTKYTFNGSLAVQGKRRFFVWAKPLLWGEAAWSSTTLFTKQGSATHFGQSMYFHPAGKDNRVYLALGVSKNFPASKLRYILPKYLSIANHGHESLVLVS